MTDIPDSLPHMKHWLGATVGMTSSSLVYDFNLSECSVIQILVLMI